MRVIEIESEVASGCVELEEVTGNSGLIQALRCWNVAEVNFVASSWQIKTAS